MADLQNRSLDRGIRILEALAASGAASLADLYAATGLPKSTIRRLLGTLIARRLVRRSLSDERYRSNITLPVSAGRPIDPAHALLVDVAMPRVVELTETVEWPSDVHVREARHMRIVDSTRPLSPFHLYRGVIDRQLNLFGCATGVMCLSTLADESIRALIGQLGAHPKWGIQRFGLSEDSYMAMIGRVRGSGYATRVPNYHGETVLDDGLAAIASPIMRGGAAIGAVTLLWSRAYQEPTRFAGTYLGALQETTAAIGRDLADYGSSGS